MQAKDPLKNLISKEKTQWNTSWAWLLKCDVSREPIVSQNLSTNPINKVLCMEQIFQDINKQMLEITYILRLGQLLKMTPNLKIYVAKTKAKKNLI